MPNDLKKMVQIVKAVSLDPKILILDEPTSSLTDSEVRVALRLIRRLASDGVGVVLISHYLSEIFEVCDHLTIMRDGAVVAVRTDQRDHPAEGRGHHGRARSADDPARVAGLRGTMAPRR